MSDHTVEPWSFELDKDNANTDQDLVYGSIIGDDYHIARVWNDSPDPEANARRIVACVNACAGLEQSFLEAVIQIGGIKQMYDGYAAFKEQYDSLADAYEKLDAQRDQLLGALKEISRTNASMHGTTSMMIDRCMSLAHDAIQSIEESMK